MYQNITILCYMDTDSFIIHIETKNIKILLTIKILLMILKNGLIHPIRPLPIGMNKNNWIDKRLIRRKYYDRICCT